MCRQLAKTAHAMRASMAMTATITMATSRAVLRCSLNGLKPTSETVTRCKPCQWPVL